MNRSRVVASISYIQRKPDSVRHFHALRPLGETTVVGHTMRRLTRGLAGLGGSRVLLAHEDEIGEQTRGDALDAGFLHITAGAAASAFPGSVVLQDVASILERLEPAPSDVLLFAEDIAFPDCEATLNLLEEHWQSSAACTIAPEYSFGLVPIAIRADMLAEIAAMAPRSGTPDSSDALLYLYGELRMRSFLQAHSREPVAARVARFPREPVEPEVLAALPLRLTISDQYAWQAASSVVSRGLDGPLDSTPAGLFKREIVAGRDTARPSEARARPRRSAVPANILYSSLRDAYSGPEQCLLSLMKGLDRRRFRPVFSAPEDCLLARRAQDAGIEIEIPSFRFDRLLPASLEYWDQVLKRRAVDLVHLDLEANPALMMAAYHRAIPVVGHVRTIVPEDMPDAAYCADHLIAVSRFVATSLGKTYFNPNRITVIHDGTDIGKFARVRRRRESGRFTVSIVARLVPGKRQDLLIQALAEAGKPAGVRALLFGESDPMAEEYSHYLRRLVHDHGLGEVVSFRGFESDVASIYEQSDALVVCMGNEALPHCIIEALAAGIPIITPDAGGSRELIRHEAEGLTYPAGDSGALCERLLRLARDTELWARLSERARQRSQMFRISYHVEQVERLYDQMLNGESGKAELGLAASGRNAT